MTTKRDVAADSQVHSLCDAAEVYLLCAVDALLSARELHALARGLPGERDAVVQASKVQQIREAFTFAAQGFAEVDELAAEVQRGLDELYDEPPSY